MNKISGVSLFLSLAALVGVFVMRSPGDGAKVAQESTFDRVTRTGVLRCGYPVWPPSMILDPNSKAISGYSHDTAEAVADKLGLKIEWTEETGWGNAEAGLSSRRYDMVCADVCLDAPRTKATWYSKPFNYTPNFVFVRKDDKRFDQDFERLNDPSVKFAVLPNTILDYAVRERFPKAGRVDANDLQNNIDLVMMVVSGKADASVNMMASIDLYNKGNSERQVKTVGNPVRHCAGAFLVPKGDAAFKQLIDAALEEISMGDRIRNIMLKYMPDDVRYWKSPIKPFQG